MSSIHQQNILLRRWKLTVAVLCAACIFPLAGSMVQADTKATESKQLLKPLPEALTSFGAMTQDGYLYVFSGHNGDFHGFSREMLNNKFRRIQYDNPSASWEDLSMENPAQSVSLVSDGRLIYRIAGLSFNNSSDEPQSFCSTDHFAAYDPVSNVWTQLPSLPEGRSSMDAAILGKSIYVVGGWNLQGESSANAKWHETMLRFDLDNPQAGWQTLPGPGYITRALTVAALDDKLYVMGGITKMGFTRKVSVYDTQSEVWSQGPDLIADHAMSGFASSAFASDGCLYNVGASGVVYRLSDDGRQWQAAERLLFPRNFLRLLPAGESRLLAVGGTGAVGRTAAVESIAVSNQSSPKSEWVSWTIDMPAEFPSGGLHCFHQGKLYLFGGHSKGLGSEALKPGNSASSTSAAVHSPTETVAVEFDLSMQSARVLADSPSPIVDGVAISHANTSAHESILVFSSADSSADPAGENAILQYDPKSDQWSIATSALPAPISGMAVARYDDALWVLGGGVGKKFNASIYHWWGDESAIAPLPGVELPHQRRDFACAAVESDFYLVGGTDADGQWVSTVDVFDAKERRWRTAASPSLARNGCSLASYGNKLFLFGGSSASVDDSSRTAMLEVYDSESDRWAVVEHGIPWLHAGMRMISLEGRLLFFGPSLADKNGYQFVLFDPGIHDATPAVRPMSLAGFSSRGGESPEQSAKAMMRRDVNKDGLVSREELGQRMAEFADRADSDGDGKLTYDEVLAELKKKGSQE